MWQATNWYKCRCDWTSVRSFCF